MFAGIILIFAGMIAFFIHARTKNSDTLQFTKLTAEEQTALSSEVDLIMGGVCSISEIKKTRIGGQAQVTYYYITVQCGEIKPLIPMSPERNGSGYYAEEDHTVVRILGDANKEGTSNLVHNLEALFLKYQA